MNREIKFRGRDKENWHYGDLVQEIRHNDNKLFDGTMTHIRNFEYKNGSYIGDIFPVNSNTIGQYTGLHDKNGKEIYEGDILKSIQWNNIYLVKYTGTAFYLYRKGNNGFNKITTWNNAEKSEVIGNIYEDSELLGGE